MSIFSQCEIDIFTLGKFDMFALQTRYDINPSCASAHIECKAHIEHSKCISKIPLGIYIDALYPLEYNANGKHFLCLFKTQHHRKQVNGP